MNQELRIILHQRVSTPRQKIEGFGLDTQLRENREYAKRLNATVIHEIISDYANEGDDREDIDIILRLLKNGTANAVMFWELDRSTRGGYGEWYLLSRQIHDLGGIIYFGHRRQKAGESPEEKAMDDIYAVFANMDKAKIRNRTMGGFRSKVLRGEYPGHGKTNYGYQRIEKGIIPHETYSLIIQEIFNRFTGQNGYIKQGVRGIKRELEYKLIPSPTGKTNWNVKTVYAILRNPIYKGTYQVFRYKSQGYIKSKNKKRYTKVTKRPVSERISVSVPPIIPETQWELAQQILDTGLENSPRNSKYDYLLAKRIKCGECPCTLRGKRIKRAIGDKFYYVCHGQDSAYAHTCNKTAINRDGIEHAVWSWVADRLLTREHTLLTLDTALPKLDDSQLVTLRERLKELVTEADNLRRHARKGIISDEELLQGREEIKREKMSIEETITRLELRKSNELLLAHHKEKVESMLEKYTSVFHELPFVIRRQIVELLDIRVMVWNTGKIEIRSILGSEVIE